MKRARGHIACMILLGLAACDAGRNRERMVRKLDSLSITVSEHSTSLRQMDSAEMVNSLALYKAYRDFLATHYRDTLDRWQAEALARFESAGMQLEASSQNLATLKARGAEIESRLAEARSSATSAATGEEAMHRALEVESKAVGEFTTAVRNEFKKADRSVRTLSQSVPLVKQILNRRTDKVIRQ